MKVVFLVNSGFNCFCYSMNILGWPIMVAFGFNTAVRYITIHKDSIKGWDDEVNMCVVCAV